MDWTSTLTRLRENPADWPTIARETGLSGMQIKRIAKGETTRPRIDTAQKIASYYDERDRSPAA